MEQGYPMTAKGKEKLEKELEYLKEEKLPKINKEVKRLRSFCDFAEDVSFSKSLEEQALVKDKIRMIEEMLNYSEIIESSQEKSTRVILGSKVTFKELPSGEEESYTIVGRVDADPSENKISTDSPIGRALLGSKLNDKIPIEIPSGKIKVKIINIS